jgi:hypothetical protein
MLQEISITRNGEWRMTERNSHTEIAEAAIKCFADDGNLDLGELNVLIGLALQDSKISEEERRIVGDVLCVLSESSVTPVVWERIKQIQRRYNV